MSIRDVLRATDWKLFRQQKRYLLRMMDVLKDEDEHLDGLLNFLDAIQHAVVDEGVKTEQEVFGELK